MSFATILYSLVGAALFALGLRGALLQPSILGRVLAINVCGSGVFLVFVAMAYRGPGLAPDPVPHALAASQVSTRPPGAQASGSFTAWRPAKVGAPPHAPHAR